MRTLIVSKKYDKKKLNNFILDTFPDLSINVLNKALRQKDIKINGIRVKENVILHENDKLDIYITDEFLFKKLCLNIIYEDSNILVVDKPVWEVKPKGTYSDKIFYVALGNKFLESKIGSSD